MATTIGPLLSVAASGSFANRLTFLKTKRGTNVRVKIHQSTGRAPRQVSQRALYKGLASMWTNTIGFPPTGWEAAPREGNESDWGSYLAENLRRWSSFAPPSVEYPITEANTAGPTSWLGSTVDGHDVELAINNIFAINDNGYAIFRSPNNGFTPTIDDLVIIQPITSYPNQNTFDHDVPSGTWYYVVRSFSDDGLWGLDSPQLTVVV